MKFSLVVLQKSALAAVATSALLAASCAPPAPPANTAAPAAPVVPDNGRYKIVVSSEGERGSVLFLVDTREGATWIYRPPVGPAINGYWSDIPRLTYPPEVWQRAIQMLMQGPPPTNAAPAAGATSPGATVPPTK